MNSLRVYIIALLIIISSAANAQINNILGEEYFENGNKYLVGGSGGLSFGLVTNLNIRPTVGYKVTERLHGGVAFFYDYYSDARFNPKYTYQVYGGAVFSRFYFLNKFFVQAEYERFLWKDEQNAISNQTLRLDKANVGLGYRNWISDNSYYIVCVLYNTFDEEFILGVNPFFRGGFVFEF